MLPLIDVVFLLLVFFIYAMLSMVVHHGLKVSLPKAGTASLEKKASISVTIDAENQLFLEGEPISDIPQLIKQVEMLRAEKEQPIFIDGDRNADLGIAVELLDRFRAAGIEEVSFSCKKEAP